MTRVRSSSGNSTPDYGAPGSWTDNARLTDLISDTPLKSGSGKLRVRFKPNTPVTRRSRHQSSGMSKRLNRILKPCAACLYCAYPRTPASHNDLLLRTVRPTRGPPESGKSRNEEGRKRWNLKLEALRRPVNLLRGGCRLFRSLRRLVLRTALRRNVRSVGRSASISLAKNRCVCSVLSDRIRKGTHRCHSHLDVTPIHALPALQALVQKSATSQSATTNSGTGSANGNFPLRGFRTGRRRLGNTMRNAHRARSKDLW